MPQGAVGEDHRPGRLGDELLHGLAHPPRGVPPEGHAAARVVALHRAQHADDALLEELLRLAEPLSDSELRVLRYLPTNLTNKEIAGELFLSVNTVKAHIKHLYAKLDAHHRSDAVQRARALGLLAPSPGRR
jgi:ATP/maltotriose-dependent transcriptional regulator MalT